MEGARGSKGGWSHGKVALVTGAGSGIGKVGSARARQRGVRGRPRRTAQGAAGGGGAGRPRAPRTLAVPTDVADPAAVSALFATAKETFGRLDVLFNNAGIGAPPVPLEDLTFEQWQAVVDVNLTGVVPLHPGGVPDHEGADAARRAHHQQRLDLGARAAAELGRPTPPPSTRSPASPSRPRSTAASTTSPAARSTSATR